LSLPQATMTTGAETRIAVRKPVRIRSSRCDSPWN